MKKRTLIIGSGIALGIGILPFKKVLANPELPHVTNSQVVWLSDWPVPYTPPDISFDKSVIYTGLSGSKASELVINAAHAGTYPYPRLARYTRFAPERHIWLYDGSTAKTAKPITESIQDYRAELLIAGRPKVSLPIFPTLDRFYLPIKIPRETYGNLYVANQSVTAKYSFRTRPLSRIDPDRPQPPDIIDPTRPIDITRQRPENERWYDVLRIDQPIGFTIWSYGKPVPNARVSLTSENGLTQTKSVSIEGNVAFKVKTDESNEGFQIGQKHWQTFIATATLPMPAVDGGASTITQAFKIYPAKSSYDHRWLGWGVSLGAACLFLLGLFVFGKYRRNAYPKIEFPS